MLCLSVCAIFAFPAYSQDKPLGLKIMENTTLTADLGILNAWVDVQTYPIYHVWTNKNENQFGAGLTLNYWFKNTFYVGGHYARGRLVGTKRTFPLAKTDFKVTGLYFSTLLSETSLRAGFNPLQLFNNNPNRRINLDIHAGHGLCYYESFLYRIDNSEPYIVDKIRGRTGKTTEAVTTLGGGIMYKINHKYDIGVSMSGRFVWNDKLDAWVAIGSANDMYSFTSLSLTYHLNPNKPKPVRFVEKDDPKPEIGPRIDSPVVAVEPPVDPTKDTTIAGGGISPNNPPKDPVAVEPVEPANPVTPTEPVEPTISTEPTDPVEPTVASTDPPAGDNNNGGTTNTTSSDGGDAQGGLGADNVSATNDGIPWSEDKGYFVIVGCFKTKENAIREAVRWKPQEKQIMNLHSKYGTWYMVAVQRYDNKKEALQHMNRLRNSGRSPGAWVHIKL